ncbi:hypothetical protein TRFO_14837 [Tritrichomonas foetus]|uniref:Uncharacterized protein n=1 Tax=Tritrichomonas foetus TaxID=1144522 RepID=A0A1J4KY82_9EUKA|nr:hypothetical protein TRFO_14837 [Tritrichomonas foetus]|eukprot:OHT14670.1 hypothetical protein TRFO_14837 [Tritrichomonas foetus]
MTDKPHQNNLQGELLSDNIDLNLSDIDKVDGIDPISDGGVEDFKEPNDEANNTLKDQKSNEDDKNLDNLLDEFLETSNENVNESGQIEGQTDNNETDAHDTTTSNEMNVQMDNTSTTETNENALVKDDSLEKIDDINAIQFVIPPNSPSLMPHHRTASSKYNDSEIGIPSSLLDSTFAESSYFSQSQIDENVESNENIDANTPKKGGPVPLLNLSIDSEDEEAKRSARLTVVTPNYCTKRVTELYISGITANKKKVKNTPESPKTPRSSASKAMANEKTMRKIEHTIGNSSKGKRLQFNSIMRKFYIKNKELQDEIWNRVQISDDEFNVSELKNCIINASNNNSRSTDSLIQNMKPHVCAALFDMKDVIHSSMNRKQRENIDQIIKASNKEAYHSLMASRDMNKTSTSNKFSPQRSPKASPKLHNTVH